MCALKPGSVSGLRSNKRTEPFAHPPSGRAAVDSSSFHRKAPTPKWEYNRPAPPSDPSPMAIPSSRRRETRRCLALEAARLLSAPRRLSVFFGRLWDFMGVRRSARSHVFGHSTQNKRWSKSSTAVSATAYSSINLTGRVFDVPGDPTYRGRTRSRSKGHRGVGVTASRRSPLGRCESRERGNRTSRKPEVFGIGFPSDASIMPALIPPKSWNKIPCPEQERDVVRAQAEHKQSSTKL